MAELFQSSRTNIVEHIKHIYDSGELDEVSTCRKFRQVRADEPFMGLYTFKGDFPVLADVKIAKNYLDEKELKILNNLVSGYFDIAEIAAMEHRPMYMKDYIAQLDAVLTSGGREILTYAGKVSHDEAMKKAESEYRKFQVQNLSPVEKAYLETIKAVEQTAKKKSRDRK